MCVCPQKTAMNVCLQNDVLGCTGNTVYVYDMRPNFDVLGLGEECYGNSVLGNVITTFSISSN